MWEKSNHLKHSFYTIYTLVYRNLFPISLKLLAGHAVSASRCHITHRLLSSFTRCNPRFRQPHLNPPRQAGLLGKTQLNINHTCHQFLGTLPQIYFKDKLYKGKERCHSSTISYLSRCLIYQSHKKLSSAEKHSWKQTLQQGSNHAYYLQQEKSSGTLKVINVILS